MTEDHKTKFPIDSKWKTRGGEALKVENEELRAKLDKAKDALEFYAERYRYKIANPVTDEAAWYEHLMGTIKIDKGHRARTALEELK